MLGKTAPSLAALFDPGSVAVIGASPGRASLSGLLIGYLDDHGYGGTVYPVNPNHDEVHGRRCFDSVLDVPEPPEAAFVLVPAALNERVVEECGRAGVRFVMVGSSGFSEAGRDDRQESLADLAAEYDLSIVGPNCEGVINTQTDLALSFSSACKLELTPGELGIVSQSGGLGGAFLQMALRQGVGLNKWVSTGNEVDVSLLDVLEHYVEDPTVGTAVAFIEGVGDGRRLLEIGRRALETGTPILALKVGDSAVGQEATVSHTGRTSGPGAFYRAAFEETAITRLESIQGYLDALESFTRLPVERFPEGRGIGVVSASGGACALIADACDRLGMELPALPDETRAELEARLPAYGSATNPVDVAGQVVTDEAFFGQFVDQIATADSIDAVLLQAGNTGPEYIEPIREDLYRTAEATGKPIVLSFAGGWPDDDLLYDLHENGVPVYPDPVAAIRALRDMERFKRRAASPPTGYARDEPRGRTSLGETWDTVASAARAAGADVVESRTAATGADAVAAAADVGYPVTVKLDAPGLAHKTELDGVRTDRRTDDEVRTAAEELLAIADRADVADAALLVQANLTGVEVICGCLESDEFGPVMTVGPGGTFVELFGERVREYVFLPASAADFEAALSRGSLGDLLENARRGPLARDGLVDTLVAMADLYLDGDATELEANPVVVTPERAAVVDLVAR